MTIAFGFAEAKRRAPSPVLSATARVL